MRRVLITGSNGYIGSHLSSRLIELGYDVLLTDRGEESTVDNQKYQAIDFTNLEEVRELIQGIDVVYFFTGKTGNANAGFEDPNEFVEGNVITLVNLLSAVKDLEKKPKIVFPSTRLLYKGNENEEISEGSLLAPRTVYAVNKLACENYLRIYNENFDVPYSIFRISLPYGSFLGRKHNSYGVMSYLVNRAKEGHELFVYGEGKQKGSLIHIHDLVQILIEGGLSEKTQNNIYNIGGPDNLEMGKVVKLIGEKFQVPVSSIEWPKISGNTDQGSLSFDSSKLLNLLGYQYEYSFEQWINQTEL